MDAKICWACKGSGEEKDERNARKRCAECLGCGVLEVERETDKRGAVRPVNRVRVVYDGEPISARVELIVCNDDGTETVHDIPCEEALFYASPKSSRLVLKIDGAFVTTHIEGSIDHLAEHQLLAVARLDPVAHGWGTKPETIAQEESAPLTADDIKTQPGRPKAKK